MSLSGSLSESKHRLERALRTRGLTVNVEGREFKVRAPHGAYSLSFMPGNRRILISHYVAVDPEMRGKGFGKRYLQQREEIAKEAGVNLLLATVRNDNEAEVHLLRTNGWRRMINRRSTGVSLWGKLL